MAPCEILEIYHQKKRNGFQCWGKPHNMNKHDAIEDLVLRNEKDTDETGA